MDRLRLLFMASIAIIILGCGTWVDYRDSSGAGKANTEVAIFKAHLEDTRRIVSASDERVEYEYDPAQKPTLGFAAHPRIRLQPGQYTITAETWPFGSRYEFKVNLEAGHVYKVQTALCSLECIAAGKPYRHDRWIQDITARKRISDVVFECYSKKKRQGERQKVPCPVEEETRDTGDADKASAAATKAEENTRDAGDAGKTSAAAVKSEEGTRDAGDADKASAVVDKSEEDTRGAGDAGEVNAEVAIFNVHQDNTRQIVSASDGRIEYHYNQKLKRTKQKDPHIPIQLVPDQYTITVKTWPFGTLYEFEVDLKAGHTYVLETDLCAFDCISTGEPYRHDRWIQDLTIGDRISDIVSECYLGKKRRRDRQKVPCPDD
ncbi:MAG: hypothetical protein QNJ26_15310 [Desulfobacterales bacterium]|nr:hypothetical protein [Desulfobacterales bacterium]